MKVTKRSVSYRRSRRGAKRRCGNCSMYRLAKQGGGAYCALVEGPIDRAYVCDRWAAR